MVPIHDYASGATPVQGSHRQVLLRVLVRVLLRADGEGGGDRPVALLGHGLYGVMSHAEPAPDVRPPPRRLGMPAQPAVGRVRHDPAVVQLLRVRPVEAGVGAVEHQPLARRQHPPRFFPGGPMSPARPPRNLKPAPSPRQQPQRCSIVAAPATSMFHRSCRQAWGQQDRGRPGKACTGGWGAGQRDT